jgi:hypothetical protein
MTRQIAPEALIALEFPGLPFHDSFHGLAVGTVILKLTEPSTPAALRDF